MQYSEFIEVYERLGATSKRLEKIGILADFLIELNKKGEGEWIYLLRGRVLPDYDSGEFGISRQLAMKAISISFGVNNEEILQKYRKLGDLGDIAEEFAKKRRQSVLFSKKLSAKKVFENLLKIIKIEGRGAVEKKIDLISELLSSASGKEAKYIIRTLLSDLRLGVADAILIEAIARAFLNSDKENVEKIENAFDLANDFALVFKSAAIGLEELNKINIIPGRATKVMLAVKANNIEEAFRICGKPAAIEQKYDGFRMLINKNKEGINLFTRKLENVTKQFPDVTEAVKKNIKGESFIFDSEIVGYDPQTKKYTPFEAISQRIKRKYDVEKIIDKLPVEINVFDVLYYNNKEVMNLSFSERRKIVEKAIKEEKLKIRPALQIITDSEKEAMKFYDSSLKAGEEGIMIKKLDAPYKPGRRVGFLVKLKPEVNDLDLVIVGAEYGSGKRAGWLTSFVVACRDGDKFMEIGRVSSGLKEKEEEGTSYEEMTELLKPLITQEMGNEVKIKPKIVVSVTYQNIQKSPSYSSGYALRFPRITNYRPDRDVKDITSLEEIEREVDKNL